MPNNSPKRKGPAKGTKYKSTKLGPNPERIPMVNFPAGQLARLKAEAAGKGIPFAEHVRILLDATKPIAGGF